MLELGYNGSQTMDIPFHISLGTYTSKINKNCRKIREVCSKIKQSEVKPDKVERLGIK